MTHTTKQQPIIQIGQVAYNATNQCFEALVTLTTANRKITYPCAILGPITMSFEKAAEGLQTQALRRHQSGRGLSSQMRAHAPRLRAGRPRFNPRAWLAQICFGASEEAA